MHAMRWTNSVFNAALKRKMIPVLWDTGGAVSRREPYAPTRELLEMLRSASVAGSSDSALSN